MNFIRFYANLTRHEYFDEAGNKVVHDYLGGVLDFFWICFIMAGIFVIGGLVI